MVLTRRLGPAVRLRYRFENAQSEPVELWVSLPPNGVGQVVKGTRLEPSATVRRCGQDPAGVNEVAYLVLDPGARAELDAEVRPERRALVDFDGEPADVQPLSEEERRRYLRATAMVPTDGAVAEEAGRIIEAAGADDDHARAWALFAELAFNYLYVYPPTRRGAAAMLEERAGDCGEFSFLFAAWCRSCGIPARTIVGTWARGKTQAHVWNEFHIDGVGWVPADASMAALVHRAAWQVWLMGRRPGRWQRYFGALPGDRVAFSVDPDPELDPPFAPVPDGGDPDMHVAGQPLRWGRDLVGTAAPYLQPAYPRFPHPPREPPSSRWDDQQPLGRWRVLPAGVRGKLALGLKAGGTGLFLLGAGTQVVELGAVGTLAPVAGLAAWVTSWLLRR